MLVQAWSIKIWCNCTEIIVRLTHGGHSLEKQKDRKKEVLHSDRTTENKSLKKQKQKNAVPMQRNQIADHVFLMQISDFFINRQKSINWATGIILEICTNLLRKCWGILNAVGLFFNVLFNTLEQFVLRMGFNYKWKTTQSYCLLFQSQQWLFGLLGYPAVCTVWDCWNAYENRSHCAFRHVSVHLDVFMCPAEAEVLGCCRYVGEPTGVSVCLLVCQCTNRCVSELMCPVEMLGCCHYVSVPTGVSVYLLMC